MELNERGTVRTLSAAEVRSRRQGLRRAGWKDVP
jgi:hypothetical protein